MKILFVYGDWCLGGRPFDFDTMQTSARGLTGSELSFLRYAREMAVRGHNVTICARSNDDPSSWSGCRIVNRDAYPPVANDQHWDAICAWNEPVLLSEVTPCFGMVRMVNQQLNDWNYCPPYWEKWVDVTTTPALHHQRYLRTQINRAFPDTRPFGMEDTPGMRWAVLPNGCDLPSSIGPKVPGRVIYASSPDRGLHRLLEVWPQIKRGAPEAHLRVFYNFQPWADRMRSFRDSPDSDMRKLSWRAVWIENALERLRGLDVEIVGQVSRERIAREMNQAMVLAYPSDPIRYTEGFSVTTMEACAHGTLPVICAADALKEIYGQAVPHVDPPVGDRLEAFAGLVVRGLHDAEWRSKHVAKGQALAAEHTYTKLAVRLERILEEVRCAT